MADDKNWLTFLKQAFHPTLTSSITKPRIGLQKDEVSMVFWTLSSLSNWTEVSSHHRCCPYVHTNITSDLTGIGVLTRYTEQLYWTGLLDSCTDRFTEQLYWTGLLNSCTEQVYLTKYWIGYWTVYWRGVLKSFIE